MLAWLLSPDPAPRRDGMSGYYSCDLVMIYDGVYHVLIA